MRSNVKEHIEQMDVRLGGGIISEKIKVETIDNPMLVIGLGGTGIDALLRLKYQINRRFILPEDPITKRKAEKPSNIEFIAFETNEQEKTKKYNGIGLDIQNELVLLSNAGIGGLLRNPSLIDPCIKEWLSPELTIKDGTFGAGGKRQAGRLLMFTRINQVVDSIEKKINNLMAGKSKKLIVFILSGLSGGTGSGCFLDIAYIIRGIMDKKLGNDSIAKLDILSYLFTPDVNLANKGLSDHTQDYIKKNGYAALKELDYWMNCMERGERFKQRYLDKISVDSPLPPFNLCHLISATNMDGTLLENAYDYCMNVTSENITNFMANEERHSGHEFAIHDYISNIDTNINNMIKPYSANYKYNIIGASSAVLPIEEITTYLAYRLFKKMERMFENAPGQNEVGEFMRQIRLDMDSISSRFEQGVRPPLPGYQNSERFSYDNIIKTQSIDLDYELKDGYLSRACEEYINVRKQYPAEIVGEYTEQCKRMFLDPSKGPFYVSRLVVTNNGYCVLKTIESYIQVLKEKRKGFAEDLKRQNSISMDCFAEARKVMLFNKDKKKNEYIESKIEEYLRKADDEKTRRMIEFYEDVLNMFNEKNNKIYNVFTNILNTLNEIFEKNGQILINSKEVEYKGNRSYLWNVVSIPDVVKTIDKMMGGLEADMLLRDFTTELLERSENWINDEELNIVGTISEFLTDKFGSIITKSMEEFLTIKYGEEQSIDRIITKIIAPKLDNDAVPVFHLSLSDGNINLPSWGLVSVPVNAPGILKGIREFQNNALGRSNYTIKESLLTNRIFWLNTKNGVPLYAYSPLKQYEECYERSIFEEEGIGRHLVQTLENNWTYLPSPIPEKSWGDTYVNNRLKVYNCEVRKLFKDAIARGCIIQKDAYNSLSNKYECLITEDFSIGEFISGYKMGLQADQRTNFSEIKRCLGDLKKLSSEGLHVTGRRDIFESFDEETAMDSFLRSPEHIKLIRKELNKLRLIDDKIKELSEIIASVEREENLFSDFIEAMYTNTICKKGALYVYDKDETEKEEWVPFVNLMKSKEYVEWIIFKNFTQLDEKHKTILKRKAEKRAEVMASSEDLSELINTIASMAGSFKEYIDSLEYKKFELVEGEEINNFYLKLHDKLNSIKNSIA